MVTPILIDVLIVAALIFFAWRGEKRGFILTLCSLAAVLVAFIGATLITNAAAPKVAEYIQPKLEQSIQQSLGEALQEIPDGGSFDIADILASLRENGVVSKWVADTIEDSLQDIDVNSYAQQAVKTIVSMAGQASKPAAALAAQLSKSILFPIFFLLLLLVWGVLSHALDLMSKVPVVNTLNHGLGGAIGLVKGVVVVYVAVWVLCGPAGVISPQTARETHLLRLMTQYDPIGLLGK